MANADHQGIKNSLPQVIRAPRALSHDEFEEVGELLELLSVAFSEWAGGTLQPDSLELTVTKKGGIEAVGVISLIPGNRDLLFQAAPAY